MDLVFFVLAGAIAAVYAQSWVVVSFYGTKPPLQRTLVDLINADFLLTFFPAGGFLLLMSTFTFLHDNFEVDVNDGLFLATAMGFQFFTQATLIYSTYNTAVRYSYVYNQRILLEDFTDEFVRRSIWILTSGVSGAMCLATFSLGMRADQYYLTMKNESEVPLYRKTEVMYSVLLLTSLAINGVLAVALKRQVGNLDEDEARTKILAMKKTFTVLVFITAVAMLRLVIGKASPLVVPTLGVVIAAGSLTFYIVSKDPLRKFVKKMLAEHLGINVVSCSNSVSPIV